MVGFPLRMIFRAPLCSAVAFALSLMAVPADAEIVYLTSGKTLSIKGHRFDGETLVLSLRGGGDVNIDKTLFYRLFPTRCRTRSPR